MKRTATTAFAIALGTLTFSPAAGAQGVDQIFEDYKNQGSVNPCSYSPEALQRAQGDVPPDVAQYAPRFGEQLGNSCPGGAGAPGAVPGAPGSPAQFVAPPTPDIKKPPAPDVGAAERTLPAKTPAPKVAAAAAAARTDFDEGVPGWALAIGLAMVAAGLGWPLVARLRRRRAAGRSDVLLGADGIAPGPEPFDQYDRTIQLPD